MRFRSGSRVLRALLLSSCFAAGVASVPVMAQNRGPDNSSNNNYYYQAYDAGFRAGQADFRAHRPSSYGAALVTTGGLAAISKDYRNAFKLGYQDGYNGYGGGNRGSDWSYKHHHHNADCDEDDSRGGRDFSCREHHDNGKHKGWYKKHHRGDDDQGENEQDGKEKD